MAGIYIHIPFCRQKCHYCNFFSVASKRDISKFDFALLRELNLRSGYLSGEVIRTIYFGGGTPSLMAVSTIEQLLDRIYSLFPVDKNVEITLEANPDDLNPEYLENLHHLGVNRLSIGIQSFRDEDLVYMNRIHTAMEAINCIEQSHQAGFENLSIDLIYGIPELSDLAWEQNLANAIKLRIPHISVYALTVEDNTPLKWLINQGRSKAVDEEQSARQFEIAMNILPGKGYEHYEISNYCQPGFYSKHNTAYWRGEKYLGLGPSAHSFDGISRQWNNANLRLYLDSKNNELPPFEREILSEQQKFNEYIMTSLRTMWGCNLEYLEETFDPLWIEDLLFDAKSAQQAGLLEIKNRVLLLTSRGKLFADGVASGLFRI